jgi:hypothetical protein
MFTIPTGRPRRRRPILRLLAVAAVVVAVLAVLAFVAGRASSAPVQAPTTTAGVAYIPDPAGPPITDPNGQWISEPYPTLSTRSGR